MKDDSSAIVEPDHPDHVLDLERVRQEWVPHVFAGGESELRLLKMKARLGESVEVADVIVVQMRDDDVLDVRCADPEQLQRVDRIAQIGALALGRDFLGEAAVDDEPALLADRKPAEIVHRHRPVMRIAADEIVLPAALAGRVAKRVHLIAREIRVVAHGSQRPLSLRSVRRGRPS